MSVTTIVAILKVVIIFHPFNDTVFIVSKTMYGFKMFGKKNKWNEKSMMCSLYPQVLEMRPKNDRKVSCTLRKSYRISDIGDWICPNDSHFEASR